ncbi:MAG TPA: acyl-CoA dehydrogenase family protein [Pseudomonadales bacterium]|nr:acyl-CoA dehydrogenase family protein [Pseudomonadales bacterium]
MDTRYSKEQVALRKQLRDYFTRIMTPEKVSACMGKEGGPIFRGIVEQLGRDGMLTLGWPSQYGGKDYTAVEQLILFEEAWKTHTPFPLITLNSVAPSLMAFGTDEQKEFFLPKIAQGKLIFAIGYSEAGSGTDLASLKTKAEFDGENWVINGSKIWTSAGHDCEYIWLAARTSNEGKRPSDGITLFIVDAKDPGYTHAPIHTVAGVDTNVTYYENVKVPPSRIVGKLNGGWKVITSQLNHERIVLAAMTVIARKQFGYVMSLLTKPDANGVRRIDDPSVASKIGEIYARLESMEILNLRNASAVDEHKIDVALASGSKVLNTLEQLRVLRGLMELVGEDAAVQFESEESLFHGHLEYDYRASQIMTVGGGVLEVMRSMAASFALGMPNTIT